MELQKASEAIRKEKGLVDCQNDYPKKPGEQNLEE